MHSEKPGISAVIIAVSWFFLFLCSCKKDPAINAAGSSLIQLDVLAENLEIPWGLDFLPNGDLLFTERKGTILLLPAPIGKYKTLMYRNVSQKSESGLMGLAVDPNFNSTHYVFIYETTDSNRVVRLKFENGVLSEDKVIVRGIPSAPFHDGGGLRFGPDGYLYIGTGDATINYLAQDTNSLAGKILRVDKDGNPAPGNPFGSRVWSLGHRNVQGFDWLGDKMLATEHGPSGEFGWCCHDEINLIEAGKNYGWPKYIAGTEVPPYVKPLIHSGDATWAPSGASFMRAGPWKDQLIVCCLKGEKLLIIEPDLENRGSRSVRDTFYTTFKRLRNIRQAPDSSIIFFTSNASPFYPIPEGHDRIYRMKRSKY